MWDHIDSEDESEDYRALAHLYESPTPTRQPIFLPHQPPPCAPVSRTSLDPPEYTTIDVNYDEFYDPAVCEASRIGTAGQALYKPCAPVQGYGRQYVARLYAQRQKFLPRLVLVCACCFALVLFLGFTQVLSGVVFTSHSSVHSP